MSLDIIESDDPIHETKSVFPEIISTLAILIASLVVGGLMGRLIFPITEIQIFERINPENPRELYINSIWEKDPSYKCFLVSGDTIREAAWGLKINSVQFPDSVHLDSVYTFCLGSDNNNYFYEIRNKQDTSSGYQYSIGISVEVKKACILLDNPIRLNINDERFRFFMGQR